jgi:hypothetical protein
LSTDRLFSAGERFASSKAYSSETLAGTPQALPQLLLPVIHQTSSFRAEILLMSRVFRDWPASYKLASPDKKNTTIYRYQLLSTSLKQLHIIICNV